MPSESPIDGMLIDSAEPVRVDPVVAWATAGFAGVLSLLERQQRSGIVLPAQVLLDIQHVIDRLDNIKRRALGLHENIIAGGASKVFTSHL